MYAQYLNLSLIVNLKREEVKYSWIKHGDFVSSKIFRYRFSVHVKKRKKKKIAGKA